MPFLLTCALTLDAAASTVLFSYDQEHRLFRCTQEDGTVIDYVYDHLGNRLMKSVSLPGSSNRPPNAVLLPGLPNAAANLSLSPTLYWQPAGDPDAGDQVMYILYLGTSPVGTPVWSGWQNAFTTTNLLPGTTYYWYIVARDNHNVETVSPTWTFTTTNIPPVPQFTASPTNGWAPLQVQFTDQSGSRDDRIVQWQWDFDNNGSIDSSARNPVYTYPSPGSYSVKLTTVDEHGATGSVVRTNLVNVYSLDGIVDLAVSQFSVQAAYSYNDLVLNVVITNRGKEPFPLSWQWSDIVYVSSNATWEPTDPIVYSNQHMQVISASYSQSNSITAYIPSAYVSNYYLIVKADSQGQIAETNEVNNVVVIPRGNQFVDLAPAELTTTGTISSGGGLWVSWKTRNQGALMLDAYWEDEVYLSTNATLDYNDTYLCYDYFYDAIGPGGVVGATNFVTLPSVSPGTYYLILDVDAYSSCLESNEANNTLAVPIVVTTNKPDLMPVSLVWTTSYSAGASVKMVATLTNSGTAEALDEYQYSHVYLSTNTTFESASDVSVGYFYWSSFSLPRLTQATKTNTMYWPDMAPGTYFILLVADTYNGITENNESNNVLALPLTVPVPGPRPDLRPLSLSWTGPTVSGNPAVAPETEPAGMPL